MNTIIKGLTLIALAAVLVLPLGAFAQEEVVQEDQVLEATATENAVQQVIEPVNVLGEEGGDSFKTDLALILSLAGIALLGVYALWDRHNKPTSR